MTFNKRIDRLESGQNTPKSPNDETIWIDTNNNVIKRYNALSSEWVGVGGSGEAGDLVVPVSIKDSNDENLITFSKTGTGTARIESPQDDLSLRSARDITLYAGSDGPGNVYIGWGDAVYTPESPNRVATIGDLESGPKTWTAPNNADYSIRQAHGGIQVELDQPNSYGDTATIIGNYNNATTITISVPSELSGYMNDVFNNGVHFRQLAMDFGPQTRYFRIVSTGPNEYEWVIETLDGPITVQNNNSYYLQLQYGGAPQLWWNADSLNLVPEGDQWTFRGAKIEYHCYSQDSGTMIGTIYIADDNDDNYVTHIETSSGANDTGNVVLWNRSGSEAELFAYRADNEDDIVKIHWTAQVYYGTEYYD